MDQLRWGTIGCDGKLNRTNQIFLEQEQEQRRKQDKSTISPPKVCSLTYLILVIQLAPARQECRIE